MTVLTVRFWAKVDTTGCACGHGCHLWTGALNGNGYGQWAVNGRSASVHRLAYVETYGPIPDGWTVDHVHTRGCRHKHCVNPAHLEAVTVEENVRRAHAVRVSCRRGHPLTTRQHYGKAIRCCRRCEADARRARRAAA